MKTPRHEQPWYECRLENNKKPAPLTDEERTIMSGANRKIIEDAPRLIAYAISKGWMSYPTKKTHFTWNNQKPIDSTSTSTTLPWSSQSSGMDSIESEKPDAP